MSPRRSIRDPDRDRWLNGEQPHADHQAARRVGRLQEARRDVPTRGDLSRRPLPVQSTVDSVPGRADDREKPSSRERSQSSRGLHSADAAVPRGPRTYGPLSFDRLAVGEVWVVPEAQAPVAKHCGLGGARGRRVALSESQRSLVGALRDFLLEGPRRASRCYPCVTQREIARPRVNNLLIV